MVTTKVTFNSHAMWKFSQSKRETNHPRNASINNRRWKKREKIIIKTNEHTQLLPFKTESFVCFCFVVFFSLLFLLLCIIYIAHNDHQRPLSEQMVSACVPMMMLNKLSIRLNNLFSPLVFTIGNSGTMKCASQSRCASLCLCVIHGFKSLFSLVALFLNSNAERNHRKIHWSLK